MKHTHRKHKYSTVLWRYKKSLKIIAGYSIKNKTQSMTTSTTLKLCQPFNILSNICKSTVKILEKGNRCNRSERAIILTISAYARTHTLKYNKYIYIYITYIPPDISMRYSLARSYLLFDWRIPQWRHLNNGNLFGSFTSVEAKND